MVVPSAHHRDLTSPGRGSRGRAWGANTRRGAGSHTTHTHHTRGVLYYRAGTGHGVCVWREHKLCSVICEDSGDLRGTRRASSFPGRTSRLRLYTHRTAYMHSQPSQVTACHTHACMRHSPGPQTTGSTVCRLHSGIVCGSDRFSHAITDDIAPISNLGTHRHATCTMFLVAVACETRAVSSSKAN